MSDIKLVSTKWTTSTSICHALCQVKQLQQLEAKTTALLKLNAELRHAIEYQQSQIEHINNEYIGYHQDLVNEGILPIGMEPYICSLCVHLFTTERMSNTLQNLCIECATHSTVG